VLGCTGVRRARHALVGADRIYEGRHIVVAEKDGGGLFAFEIDDSDPKWQPKVIDVKLPERG
jgi:hypothetical protein